MPSKAKEAYLRRHNLKQKSTSSADPGSPASPAMTERSKTPEPANPPQMASYERRRSLSQDDLPIVKEDSQTPDSPAHGPTSFSELSWAQKRKMHIAARASGQSHRASADIQEVPVVLPKPAHPEGHKTWAERRKEAFLATHNAKAPKEVAIGAKVIMFAALLRQRSKQTSETGQSPRAIDAGETADSLRELSGGAPRLGGAPEKGEKGAQERPHEKTWKQKRKESYLARHSPRQATQQAHVAVTAVQFAIKLKRSSRASAGSMGKPDSPVDLE